MITRIVALAILIVGGIVGFLIDTSFDAVMTPLELNNPAYYSGAGPDFLDALINWLPFFLGVVPAVIYALVQSQKPSGVYT